VSLQCVDITPPKSFFSIIIIIIIITNCNLAPHTVSARQNGYSQHFLLQRLVMSFLDDSGSFSLAILPHVAVVNECNVSGCFTILYGVTLPGMYTPPSLPFARPIICLAGR